MKNFARLLACIWLLLAASSITPTSNQGGRPRVGGEAIERANAASLVLAKSLMETGAKKSHALLYNNLTGRVIFSVSCLPDTTVAYCTEDGSFMNQKWEPGSIFKPIVLALLIDDNAVNKNEVLHDDGYIMADGYRIENVIGDTGKQYLINEFLGESRNTGAVTLLRHRGSSYKDMDTWSERLNGIIDHDSGYIPSFGKVRDPLYRYYESSFGVGITISPLELVRIYSSFSHEGLKCDSNGTCREIIKPSTASYVKELLHEVASNYAGVESENSKCKFGGKSGTALVAQNNGIYVENHSDGTYVGYIDSTESTSSFTLLVRLDEPLDALASRPAKLSWISIAGGVCSEFIDEHTY